MELDLIELIATIGTLGALIIFIYWVRGQNETSRDLVEVLNNAIEQLGQNANEAYKQAPETQRVLVDSMNALANTFERLAYALAPGTAIYDFADAVEDVGDKVTGEIDVEPDDTPVLDTPEV